MASGKHRFYHRPIDAPSVLIAIAALAMWMFWPHIRRMPEPRALPSPRVFAAPMTTETSSLALRPDLFALPSPMGFSGIDFRGGLPEIPRAALGRPPHFLPRTSAAPGAEAAPPEPSHMIHEAEESLAGYVHRADNQPVFGQSPSPEMRLLVESGGCLKRHGFATPPVADEDIKYLDKAWMVRLFVNCNAEGGVENVFIENGCDDRRINDMVIRMVSKGRLVQPGTRCSGRVTVNFGAW